MIHSLLATSTSAREMSLTPSEEALPCSSMDELVHDLRQPLSTIECIAYYLEITTSDERVRAQAERIHAMIWQAHRILENQSAAHKCQVL